MISERVMPFDFITQRKVKQFFKEPTYDMNTIMLNKDFAAN